MKKEVMLNIRARQQFIGCEEDGMELITGGKLYVRGGKVYVTYEESELTGLAGARTTLRLDGQRVTMLRSGTAATQMEFCQGERHVGLYPTPGGPLTVATYTERVDNRIGADGGTLRIDYAIEIEHSVAGRNRFEVTVQAINQHDEVSEYEQH